MSGGIQCILGYIFYQCKPNLLLLLIRIDFQIYSKTSVLLSSSCWSMLLITFLTIHRPIAARFERDFTLFSTVTTCRFMHFSFFVIHLYLLHCFTHILRKSQKTFPKMLGICFANSVTTILWATRNHRRSIYTYIS